VRQTIAFGDWLPDAPPHVPTRIDLLNAYPAPTHWRPVGQFTAITDPLGDTFNGGVAYVASDGTSALFAGSLTNLYRYSAGAWNSVISGLTTSGRWQFTQFDDLVIAVNGGATQYYDMITSACGDLAGAPSGTSVATVRDFVVIGEADGDRLMVQWSGFNDPNGWTPGTNESGFQPMLSGGEVMGVTGGEYGLIIQRNAIKRMSYLGEEPWFQFDEIANNVGCVAKGSIAKAGDLVFFLSDRGFMVCDGATVKPIGSERVDRTFFAKYPRSTLDQLYSAVDPNAYVVMWVMPGNPGFGWGYNWAIDKWFPVSIPMQGVFSGFTTNTSLDDLDALFPGGLDSIPYSLDDSRFAGGDPLLLFVDNAGQVGTLSGENMAAYFATSFMELVPGRRARLRRTRPICDAVTGLSMTIDAKQRLGDRSGNRTVTNLRSSGDMPVRSNGRHTAFRIDCVAGGVWSYMQGFDVEFEAGTAR